MSELDQSIRLGSAVADLEEHVARLALRATITSEGRLGQQWSITLSNEYDWSITVTGQGLLEAVKKANKAVVARDLHKANR